MPRPKNSAKKTQNFGSRKSKDKEDFLGKKKTEAEKEKQEEKAKKKKEKAKEEKEEKAEKKKEEKEKKEKLDKIKEELKEKAKKLAEEIEKKEKIKDLKEEVKGSEKEAKRLKRSEKTLFPLDDYVRYSSHLGTKAVTPHMRQFVYKRRADGLAVLNTTHIDEKLKEAAKFLADFAPEDVFIACKRETGWVAAKKFSEATGIRVFTKKYPAGIITNSELYDFFETDLVIICDPWLDKNALSDAIKVRTPVIGLCDTNNFTKGITKIVPCNNKAAKSIGLILYLLAREYLKLRKEKKKLNMEDFTGEVEIKEREKVEKGAEKGV
jgi:small subunit ribosomal protein S2